MTQLHIEHASSDDVMAVCTLARQKLSFDVGAADLQILVDAAAITVLKAHEHDFLLSVTTAAGWVLDITKLRGLDADQAGFHRTADLVMRIDNGIDGVVSPGVLLLQMVAAGPLAKTMSDDGLIGFAAMVTVEEKQKLTKLPIDAQQPFFAEGVGKWSASGYSFDRSRMNYCAISRADESDGLDGSNTSTNAVSVAHADGELQMFRILSVATTLREGPKAPVTLTFEKGKTFKADGKVAGQRPAIVISPAVDSSLNFVEQFRGSKSLTIAVLRRKVRPVKVDLDGAAEAQGVQMDCFKSIPERAMALARASSQEP